MKNMIKTILCICLFLLVGNLAGCQNNDKETTGEKIKIVTTIFPEYDWVREILGDKVENADITMLLDNGVDLHSYQPTADDIIKISNCDMFIYVGGESDEWVEDALKNATNKDMVVINLLEILDDSLETEEMVEGMQENEHVHDHEHEEIAKDDVKDRSLSDFDGDWQSLYPHLVNGSLDEYCEHQAEDDEDDATTKETYLEKYKSSWLCEVDNISIDKDTIEFKYRDGSVKSAKYSYSGFALKMDDDGDIHGVRYQFKTDDENAPKYVQFEDHEHEPKESEHFHIYLGNESFEALMDAETNPYFMSASLSADEILDELIGHEHEGEYDEHVWLSLKHVKTLCKAIADKLSEIDPNNSKVYTTNLNSYIEKLSVLDNKYQEVVDEASGKTLLFGDRFPFRYLVDDYGLDYYAAFAGCSAETEASFETITFLSDKVDELELSCVMTLEGSQHKIAQTIIANTENRNQKILSMDSLQSITSQDVENGVNYMSVMEKNLEVLKEALK